MKQLFVSLLCLMGVRAIAQQNYVPGTIVTPQHDTLKGFIDFRNWSSSPAEIHFRPSRDGNTTTYTPAQVSGFRMYFNGETMYVTKHVLLDVTRSVTTSINMAVETPTTELMDSTLFIQQLVAGSYYLYSFRDKYDRKHFMYGMPGEEPLELKYTKTMIAGEYGGKLFEDKEYQQQLAEIFKDDAVVARKARKVEYNEDRLIALFSDYNQQNNPRMNADVTTRTKPPVYFGVTGGPSFNSFKWRGGSGNALTGVYNSSVGFVAGIFADIPFTSEATRKFSIYTELLFRSVSTDGDVANGKRAFFKFSYLHANLMGRYTYPKGLIKPFANIGFSAGYMIKTTKNDLYDKQLTSRSQAIDKPRSYEPMIVAGIGLKVDRFSLEVRGTRASGWVPYSRYSLPAQSVQLIAGVRPL
jgi:hypothetical protein